MIKSKIIEALQALDKNEIRKLESFIDSPFFNKNKNVSRLFKALKVFHPSFANAKLTKEFIYSKIFPGRQFADKTFRNLMSDLLSLIEKFIGYTNFAKNPFLEKYYIVSGLAHKRLLNLTESSLKESDEMYGSLAFDGGDSFYIMHLLEMQKDFLAINKNKIIDLNMKEGEYLLYAFLSKYFIFKMKYFNYRYKSRTEKLSEIIEEFEKAVDLEKFISYLENNSSAESELILIYYYCTKFMNNISNDIYYEKVKLLFRRKKHMISRSEKINLYLTLNAYCIVKIRADDKRYERELFELYMEMFEENLVLGEGETNLHITIFYNVFMLALRIGDTGYAKSFIENNYSKLLPEYRDTMFNFSYAYYYFNKREFEKALVHINKVNFENYYIKSGARILLLKIYFELKYAESFFSLSDTIKHYLAHDKLLPEDVKKTDQKFIILADKIYKYKLEPSKYQLRDIELEITNKMRGTHKDWLLEKVKEALK